ncbi:MAG: DUF6335 family protein [Candidatus Xenobia bacterium]
MSVHELNVEGVGVIVRPEWHRRIEREVGHLEAHHAASFSRLTVRFKPVRPHRRGMSVDIDGRVQQHSFQVHREGRNVSAVIHEAFDVIRRDMDERIERSHYRPGLPSVELDERADTVDEGPEPDPLEEREAARAEAVEDMAASTSGATDLVARMNRASNESVELTGGDPEIDLQDAASSGEEAVGGDSPTPGQDMVDDIGRAVGLAYQDDEPLETEAKLNRRDRHRWELDPASAEDYQERMRDR